MDPAALQVLHHVLDARRAGSTDAVSLPGADLRGAQLLRADLIGADLHGAGLDHAQLAGAKLGRANLDGALLTHADLAGADLTGASLVGADLSHARLEGAVLAGADLRGANVDGVIGEPASIAAVLIDQAMCIRSNLPDADIVQLWTGGAIIDDLEHFDSLMIRGACSQVAEDLASDAGPPTRRISDIEVEARKQRLSQDDEMPPSARMSAEVLRLVAMPDGDAPMSLRTLKLVAPILTPDMVKAPAWKAGDTVLGISLESVIGEGNAAAVWLGRDPSGEPVAVKLFKALRASVGLSLPAFRRGVSVMNRLTGPDDAEGGVMQLRCVSLNKLGVVMDHASNGSAQDLPALQWKVKSAVAFFDKLCRTVERAHERGALHRCLKPSNVLLDADLKPILCDFDMVDLPTLAAESRDVGGYRAYAAPEELLGHGTQSPTADVYSLGRILHFLLLGEPPAAPVGAALALDDLKSQPAGLVRIIRKCTMRAPEARYQQVAQLCDELGRYEDYENVGVAGGPEENFLPHRVSSLSHRTPWLSGGQRAPLRESARPPRERTRPRPDRPDRPRPRTHASEPDPLGLSRNTEKLLGAIGLILVFVSLVAVMLSNNPAPSLVRQMQALSGLGGMLTSLLMRRATSRALFWRFAWMVIAAGGLYMANLPGLAAPSQAPPIPKPKPAPPP